MKKEHWKTNLILIILYVAILALIFIFPLIKLVKAADDQYEKEYNVNKTEAIKFLKSAGIELEKNCKQMINEKSNDCKWFAHFELCYNEDGTVLIRDAKGLAIAPWKLLYKDNEWYYCYKTCDKTENISESIKK